MGEGKAATPTVRPLLWTPASYQLPRQGPPQSRPNFARADPSLRHHLADPSTASGRWSAPAHPPPGPREERNRNSRPGRHEEKVMSRNDFTGPPRWELGPHKTLWHGPADGRSGVHTHTNSPCPLSASGTEARESLARYFSFYNAVRLHQCLEYRTPDELYFSVLAEPLPAAA